RASERISVSDFVISDLFLAGFRPRHARKAPCRYDPSSDRRAASRRKTQTWKVLRFSIPIGTRDEPDDLRAHASPSHTAIATKPATASAIKYTVMPASSAVNQLSSMIALPAIISGANPIRPSAIRMADRRWLRPLT